MTDIYDRAWEILATHVGHKNPIKSAELSRLLEVGDDKRGTRETRAIILEVIRRGLPVGATEEGYFVLQDQQELEGCIQDLTDRIAGIQQRGVLITRAFNDYKGGSGNPVPLHWTPEAEERA